MKTTYPAVLLEMVNFHNYGDFQGLLVRKNYGEFTIEIMVNFDLGRIYSKFYQKMSYFRP